MAADLKVPLIDYHAEILKLRPDDWNGGLPQFKADAAKDGYAVPTLIAAGIVLVREAGGFVTDIRGGDTMLETGDIVAGKVKLRRDPEGIVFYKNNTGLAMQFAACGAILHRKLLAEGTNRTIPKEWFASGKYHL